MGLPDIYHEGNRKGMTFMEILSERELAKKLNVSPWTIRNWRLNEGLPHVRTGKGRNGRFHYNLASVKKWWAERERANLVQKEHDVNGIRQIH